MCRLVLPGVCTLSIGLSFQEQLVYIDCSNPLGKSVVSIQTMSLVCICVLG